MQLSSESIKPIYMQIAEQIEDEILTGTLNGGDQVYSTNQIAALYQINPATVGKGFNLLVEEKIIYKRRGLGMFVAEDAVSIIQEKRKQSFYEDYLTKMLVEAKKLGMTKNELVSMIEQHNNFGGK